MLYTKTTRFFLLIAFSLFFQSLAIGAPPTLRFHKTKFQTQLLWDGAITDIHFNSTITGYMARTEMTISLLDTLGSSNIDSLEAILKFPIPPHSVIDSLYLLIDGKMESGYLKKTWVANMIFENIVKRKQDPALLRKDSLSDNYKLQIFPCFRGKPRTIKITYTTPLEYNGGNFLVFFPIDISSASCYPVKEITADIAIKDIPAEALSVDKESAQNITISKVSGNESLMKYSSKSQILSTPLTIYCKSTSFDSSGISIHFAKDSANGIFFSALLQPAKLLNVGNSTPKKILFVWNNVFLSQVTFDEQLKKYFYKYSFNFTSNTIREDLSNILSFIKSNVNKGDMFNFVFNDGVVQKYSNSLIPYCDTTYQSLNKFINDSLTQVDKDFGCESPVSLLEKSISTCAGSDSVIVIYIDKYSHASMESYDTTFVKNEKSSISKLLPKKHHLILCVWQGNPSIISCLYDALRLSSPGSFISINETTPFGQFLNDVSVSFVRPISPVNITFQCPESRFPHDIIGSMPSLIYPGTTYRFLGRIFNSQKLRLTLNGVFEGKQYTFDKTYSVDDTNTSTSALSDIWGFERVGQILSQGNVSVADNKTGMDISLAFRILTPYTALISLEKKIADSLKMADDVPGNFDTLFLTNNNQTDDIIPSEITNNCLNLSKDPLISIKNKKVFITFPSNTEFTTEFIKNNISCKILDARGIQIADLTPQLSKENRTMVFAANNLAHGVYIIRIKIKNNVITRHFVSINSGNIK